MLCYLAITIISDKDMMAFVYFVILSEKKVCVCIYKHLGPLF